jgi:hypothetical protein
MPLLFVAVLSSVAMAQDVRALQPLRVSVAADEEATPTDREFNSLLRDSLGKLNAVRFTSNRFDIKVLTASATVTEGGRRAGYASAVATLTKGADGVSLRLHITTAPSLNALADEVADYLKREIFPTIEKRKQ